MLAKYHRRKECKKEKWAVYLYWQGKKYKRYHYDERVPLNSEFLAERICTQINGDIERLGKNFDPRMWFRTPGHHYLFRTYVESWLEMQKHLAPSYQSDVKGYVRNHWLPFFGDLDIRTIRTGHLEDFLHRLPDRLAPKTKKNILAALHKVFSDAYRRDDIRRIPPFPRVDVPEPELKWITKDWQEKIVQAMPEHDRPIFLFGMFYGLRPGEARAFMWDCVDWDTKLIIIKRTFSGSELREITKNKRIRPLPLVPQTEVILKPIRGLGGFVFRTVQGKPYRKQRLSQLWREARDKVGAPKVTLYQGMRHSCGMRRYQEWGDIEAVRVLLGHQRTDMTRRYARATAETLRTRFHDPGMTPED